jgi:hypothetical protein
MKEIKKFKKGTWDRVTGGDLQPYHKERHEAAKNRVKDPAFIDACKKASINPTNRQARKWNNGKGAAFKTAHRIQMDGFKKDD